MQAIRTFSPRRRQLRTPTASTSTTAIPAILTHPVVLIVWTIVCVAIGIKLLLSGYSAREILRHQVQAEQELRKEEVRGAKLIEEIESATSEYAKEKRYRDELGLQKEGEIILQPQATQ